MRRYSGLPGARRVNRRDIEIIQRELPLDLLELNILTPLPGSEDHQVLWKKGIDMDADLNKYDLEHVVTDHPVMSRAELQALYVEAWSLYYTRAHIETMIRRAFATGVPVMSLIKMLARFSNMVQLENLNPLQGGILRMKPGRSAGRAAARERACLLPAPLRGCSARTGK